MTQPAQLPDPEKMQRGGERLREACQMLDALNLMLDDVDRSNRAENRYSPLYIHRLEKAKRLLDSRQEEQGG